MAERPHRAKERWRRIGLLLVSTVLLGALFSRAAAAEDAFRYERFVADFSRPSEDWALEGHWAIRSGQLVHTLQPGSLYPIADARLRGRVWQNPTIELEFSVEEYGEYGLVRVMFGWQDRWNGYGVAFSEGGTALYRYDGSWDRAVLLGSSPFKAQAGARYRVRIEVDDFHFRVYAGDELIITASDLGRRYSEGYTGIKIGNFVRTTVTGWSVAGEARRHEPEPAPIPLPSSFHGSPPLITGTFLQLDATTLAWTADDWRREFEAMEELGIDTLLLQWTGNRQRQEMYYESDVLRTGHRLAVRMDLIQLLLDECAARGISFWLGAYRDATYARHIDDDIRINMAVIDELADRYGNHPAFAGWYLTNEFVVTDVAPVEREYVRLVATLADYARQKTPGKPVALKPALRMSVAWPKPETAAIYWEDFLRAAKVDVLILQDGMGLSWRGGWTADQLVPYYQAMAVAAHRAGVQFWTELENFITDQWEPADIERVLEQLHATAPRVNKVIVFEFNHYMSPVRNALPARLGSLSARAALQQFEAYREYLTWYRAEQVETGSSQAGD